TFLAYKNLGDNGVSFRGFQAWIYYPTWTRLDPLAYGVALAAIERFRPNWWERLLKCAPWLWLPAFALIAYALYLGETENLTVVACVWQFPLIAIGMPRFLFARSVRSCHFVELGFLAQLSSPALPTAPTSFRNSSSARSNSFVRLTTSRRHLRSLSLASKSA